MLLQVCALNRDDLMMLVLFYCVHVGSVTILVRKYFLMLLLTPYSFVNSVCRRYENCVVQESNMNYVSELSLALFPPNYSWTLSVAPLVYFSTTGLSLPFLIQISNPCWRLFNRFNQFQHLSFLCYFIKFWSHISFVKSYSIRIWGTTWNSTIECETIR